MFQYSCLEIVSIIFLSFYVIKLICSVFRGFWTCFLAHSLGYGVEWRSGDNVWAVITGATDGIGLEYAKQLASKGYSLMIISRNEDKLNSTAKSLMKENPNCKEVKIIAVDFSRTDIYDKIENELNKLDLIDVLVNNVGTLYGFGEYFAEIPSTCNRDVMNVNMHSYTRMLEIVLPKMVEQKRGIIINVSSQAAIQPVPLMSIYSASKAYVTFLSESVSVEYESKGVIIQTVLPSLVKTKLNTMSPDQFFSITPQQCVSSAMNSVGIETLTYGHWKHKLLAYITSTIASICGNRLSMRLALNMLKQERDKHHKENNLTDN